MAGSFKTPILHFVGRPLSSWNSSISGVPPSDAELRPKKDRARSEVGVPIGGLPSSWPTSGILSWLALTKPMAGPLSRAVVNTGDPVRG